MSQEPRTGLVNQSNNFLHQSTAAPAALSGTAHGRENKNNLNLKDTAKYILNDKNNKRPTNTTSVNNDYGA